MSSEWPETVPVLTGRDFCRGAFSDDRGCHCMSGWMCAVFKDACVSRHVSAAIHAEIGIVSKNTSGMLSFNDDTRHPKPLLAAVWNRAMRRLGYTEIID